MGEYTVTATATDKAGNTATDTVKYRVIYKWDGFRQPITDTAHDQGAVSVFKAGSTIPVKYQRQEGRRDGRPGRGGVVDHAGQGQHHAGRREPGGYGRRQRQRCGLRLGRQPVPLQLEDRQEHGRLSVPIGVLLDDGQTYVVTIGLR